MRIAPSAHVTLDAPFGGRVRDWAERPYAEGDVDVGAVRRAGST
jgi:hypothetical protein